MRRTVGERGGVAAGDFQQRDYRTIWLTWERQHRIILSMLLLAGVGRDGDAQREYPFSSDQLRSALIPR